MAQQRRLGGAKIGLAKAVRARLARGRSLSSLAETDHCLFYLGPQVQRFCQLMSWHRGKSTGLRPSMVISSFLKGRYGVGISKNV